MVFPLCRSKFSEQLILEYRKFKTYHKLSLHDEKVVVWCVISAHRIIGCIFYDDIFSIAARYMNNILSPFFMEITEEERLYGVFQQDSVRAYMAHMSLETLQEVFDDCIISCNL